MKYSVQGDKVSFQFLHTNENFLKNINLHVRPGECVLICGRSGSGKTTFTRLINGVSPNFIEGDLSGELYTYDLKAGEADIEKYVPLVGSVFQNPKTQHFAVDTTGELAFPLENMGKNPGKILDRIDLVADRFSIKHLLDRNIFDMSGGEKQQIAFATANMTQPKVLVLDEVTSNLDGEAIERIRAMIDVMKSRGMTIILTEHRLAWTKGLVDRYMLFSEGEVIEEWVAEEFYRLTNEELNQLGLRSMDLSEHQQLLEEKASVKADPLALHKEAILETRNLTIGYKKQTQPILSNLNLSFKEGEIVGIMGENGTGKSTLSLTLTGLLKPLSGSILWEGKEITSKELVKKSFLVMQDTNYQLFSDSVEDEVLIGAKYPEAKDDVLNQLNLYDVKERHPMSLSGGQKQRVAIASAILSGKELIIFDEPTSGLDFDNMARFGKLLLELKEAGVVVLVVTHDTELAASWCDKILTLTKR